MIIITVLAIALGIFLFSMDRSWSNVVSASRNDLVFEGRNMEYGAYAMRSEHHKNVILSLLLSVGLIGGGFLAISAFRTAPVHIPPNNEAVVIIPVDITPAKPAEKKPEEKPRQTTLPEQRPPAGMENNEIEVVDNGETNPRSDLDRRDIQQGDGGEGPDGFVEPVVVGGEEGGGTEPVVAPKKQARRFVKNAPLFPGGVEEMMKYMQPRVKYSERDLDRNVQGTIYITFTVNEDGSISDIFVERGIYNGEGLAQKAMDAISKMPRWKPGDDGEEPLPVMVTMPLKMELRD